jgi:hypothetical protein
MCEQKRFLSAVIPFHRPHLPPKVMMSTFTPTINKECFPVNATLLSIWQCWFWTLTTVIGEEPCCSLDGNLINSSHSAAKIDSTTAINYAPNDDAKHITLSRTFSSLAYITLNHWCWINWIFVFMFCLQNTIIIIYKYLKLKVECCKLSRYLVQFDPRLGDWLYVYFELFLIHIGNENNKKKVCEDESLIWGYQNDLLI